MTDDDTADDLAEDTALGALRELISEGKGAWRSTYAGPAVRILLRPWPDDSVNSLTFGDVHRAYGERVNHDGNPVWQLTGTVATVAAALRALPAPDAPDAPDAPRTVLPRRDAADRDM